MTSSPLNESLLDAKLAELEKVRQWSPRVISKLENTIRSADDFSVFRINPIAYAADKNMTEEESIALFLHGTKLGLFEIEWNVVCASCGDVVRSFSELARLHSHFICTKCFAENEVAMDTYIQVSFSVSAQIRDNVFYHPEQLKAFDLYMRYFTSKDIRPNSPDGSPYPDSLLSLTVFLDDLPDGASVDVETNLIPGILMMRGMDLSPLLAFEVQPDASPEKQQVPIRLADGKCIALAHEVQSVVFPTGVFNRHFPQLGQLSSGLTTLHIENHLGRSNPLWILNLPVITDEKPMEFTSFFSGKHLLTNQTFRTLFRSETVQADEGIAVNDITLLFTDLKGSTALYDQIGDPKAYYLVRQHFDTLQKVIGQHSGSVVKTIGDAVMATFMTPTDAISAAIEMLRDLEEFNRAISQKLSLKIGIHRGHSIVVTLNDRLDYFGQTVNIAARVQSLADADEIYITDDAFASAHLSDQLEGCQVTAEEVSLKGVSGKLRVHKIML